MVAQGTAQYIANVGGDCAVFAVAGADEPLHEAGAVKYWRRSLRRPPVIQLPTSPIPCGQTAGRASLTGHLAPPGDRSGTVQALQGNTNDNPDMPPAQHRRVGNTHP